MKIKTILSLLSIVITLSACHENSVEPSMAMNTVSTESHTPFYVEKIKQIVYEEGPAAVNHAKKLIGNQITKTQIWNVDTFNSIKISSGFKVKYVVSPMYKVEVTGEENLIPYIRHEVMQNTLSLNFSGGSYELNRDLSITVYAPQLQEVKINGESEFEAQKIKANQLTVSNMGSSTLIIHNLEVNHLKWKNDGISKTEVKGHANYVDLESASLSDFNWSELVINDLQIKMSGLGSGKFTVKKSASGTISGSSSIKISGGANLSGIKTQGLSEVNKKTFNETLPMT